MIVVPAMLMQQRMLLDRYPGSRAKVVGAELAWIGALRPSSMSRTYRVKVIVHPSRPPRIVVLEPRLKLRHGEKAPHLYSDGSLCLYYPAENEWDHSMSIADTIVPWTSEWLLHYEIWLATGIWTGGGEHPAPVRRSPPRMLVQFTPLIHIPDIARLLHVQNEPVPSFTSGSRVSGGATQAQSVLN